MLAEGIVVDEVSAPQAATDESLSVPAAEETKEPEVAQEVSEHPARPWTPSYSVETQGPGVTD